MFESTLASGLPLIDAALRGALLALLALVAANMARLRSRLPLEQVGLALALCLCVQVLVQAPAVEAAPPAWWRPPLVGVAMGNSVLFWLFARALCDDDFALAPRHRAAWAAVAVAGALNLALLAPWCQGGAPTWAMALSQTVFALPLLFGLLAIRAAAQHWRDDLVERRRWLRAAIVIGGAAYTVAMVVARGVTPDGRLSAATAAIDVAVLLLIVGATAWMLLRPTRGALLAAVPALPAGGAQAAVAGGGTVANAGERADDSATDGSAGPSSDDPAEARLAAALERAMLQERAYKDPALSVAGLAARLGVPEYRLRRHINQRLGQRNFNAYLNGFRLAESQAALADLAQRHLPVLTIALEAGFGSIGPFNRAFKASTGLTPTDFRRQHSADS